MDHFPTVRKLVPKGLFVHMADLVSSLPPCRPTEGCDSLWISVHVLGREFCSPSTPEKEARVWEAESHST